jgi:predicted RNA-binding protein
MDSKRTYWLDLFTYSTWRQFLNAGASVTGFRDRRWSTVKQIKPGDYLLSYLTGISRWIGLLEARSEGYLDEAPLWTEALFPARVKVKLIVELASETAVPVFDLRDQLSIFRNLQNPNAWTGHFRGSPTRWKPSDGEAVAAALLAAKSSPVKGCRSEEATQDASRPTEQDGSGHGTCL